jgi:hypothetical protein
LICNVLTETEPRFEPLVSFTEHRLPAVDAVIATGSNNSSRYFEYYFSKYPHIIRKNRNGVAVLTGSETTEELVGLGEDVFRYFGLGCRNVTRLFVPEGYEFPRFFEAIINWGEEMIANKKYMNNYEYYRTVYLLNKISLLDNNFLMLKEDTAISSPPGVLFYSFYNDLSELKKQLRADRDMVQCIVSNADISGAIPFGKSQETKPSDYADGVDVMHFLLNL